MWLSGLSLLICIVRSRVATLPVSRSFSGLTRWSCAEIQRLTHACVRCVSALTEGRLSLDVHRIHRSHRRRFLEFWSFVEIREPDECWPWHGPKHSANNSTYFSYPRHWGKGRQYSAPRVAFWLTWGDIGRLPIKHTCGQELLQSASYAGSRHSALSSSPASATH